MCFLVFLIYFLVSSKFKQVLLANGKLNLFARPGVISDSWITTGMRLKYPAITTGKETHPPFENIISTLSLRKRLCAWNIPIKRLNGSKKFCQLKYDF